MSISRRNFLADASMLGLMSALLPELAAAQTQSSDLSAEDLPHDSFDSVNPYSANYGNKAATRGPEDQLPDPAAQTRYLHYDTTNPSDHKKEHHDHHHHHQEMKLMPQKSGDEGLVRRVC